MSVSVCIVVGIGLQVLYDTVDSVPIEQLDCSFETGFCQYWTNISAAWIRDQYAYQLPQTGPQTSGGRDKDYYIYVPPMTDESEEKIAKLVSSSFTNDDSQKTCFRFWYYMFGVHVRNLTITSGTSTLFHVSGNKSSSWKCGVFDATGVSGQITINAYRTTEPYSVIAIDHIQIIKAVSCSSDNCDTLETIPTTTTKSSSGSTISSTITSTNSDQLITPPEGVLKELPIVIGVPCGVLVVGVIIAAVCIYRRRTSMKSLQDQSTPTAAAGTNIYSSHPMSVFIDDEVYHELDENQMIDNEGYLDPTSYDECKDIQHNTTDYVNGDVKRPQSENYIEPESVNKITARHSSDDYLNVQGAHRQENDYLDVDGVSIDSSYIDARP